jgi:crotonobetainyl-CoA:carnitine CoA-transferase CaiB-like acyl-CoA transferase
VQHEAAPGRGFLTGVRVLEFADELGEYCGKVLAGLGADVIKVEPPGGEVTRSYGPFSGDTRGPETSLYFWHFNFGKRAVTCDLSSAAGRAEVLALTGTADVILDARSAGSLAEHGLDYQTLAARQPAVVMAEISPFGRSGPWASYRACDLVHLALGGVMMNCGYDPDPTGCYDTPPMAPQLWQSYQIAGELTVIAILGALCHRAATGTGQSVSVSVHQAVAQNTETDVPNWIFTGRRHYRRTCRHSRPDPDPAGIAMAKDGRWLLPYRSYLGAGDNTEFRATVELLDGYGMADDLADPRYADVASRADMNTRNHIADVISRFVARWTSDRSIWQDAQEAGLTWAPLRRPEENANDGHWRSRQTFLEVEHPGLSAPAAEIGAKWRCPEVPWRVGPRAPYLGEHDAQLRQEAGGAVASRAVQDPQATSRRPATPDPPAGAEQSVPGPADALAGVRVLDFGWLLASAGAGRFLAAMGAEVIKVEHRSRWDRMRWANALVPESAAGGGPGDGPSPNRGGFFMDINAGKRAISLNTKHPRAREILRRLVSWADVVAEGFSPGTMDRMGLGYAALREIDPGIIYVQQSGMGQQGSYGMIRSYGPVAQAFSGLSEMSGLPSPYPPAGIGYSYLDWFGAYNMATAILAALYRRAVTGSGCWIDSSQVEAGIYLTGTAVLDWSVNGRSWSRSGNRSPYKPAAPHGVFPTLGDDRWIAIACFDDHQWNGICDVLGSVGPLGASEFATLAGRLARQDELEDLVAGLTRPLDGWSLMAALQAAGVPAGVCQTAEDRCERDPQLRHLGWLAELPQAELGTWRCKEFPADLSVTPARVGGPLGRHGPSYGEDNEYVYGELLGYSTAEIAGFVADGVL